MSEVVSEAPLLGESYRCCEWLAWRFRQLGQLPARWYFTVYRVEFNHRLFFTAQVKLGFFFGWLWKSQEIKSRYGSYLVGTFVDFLDELFARINEEFVDFVEHQSLPVIVRINLRSSHQILKCRRYFVQELLIDVRLFQHS